jgi:hypothetical protein
MNRKMKNKVSMGLAILLMITFLVSCGKAPQDQIDAVNASIEAAKAAEADLYFPTEFAVVQDQLDAIMVDIEAQKSKLFGNYDSVKMKLDSTLALANQLTANIAVKKEEVKKEVETLITEIKTVIKENNALITRAPRGKEGQAVIDQIKTEMDTIEGSVVEAQGLFDKGAFMDALNKIKAAGESATGINTELKEAIAKVRR